MGTKDTERAKRWRRNSGKKRVEVYLDPALYQALAAQAAGKETTLAEWVRELLSRAVLQPGQPPVESSPAPGLPPILFDTSAAVRPERIKALVRDAWRLQTEGLTQEDIAQRWNKAGIPTLRWQARDWTWKNVSNLLLRHSKGGG